jgi:hypothetical protein
MAESTDVEPGRGPSGGQYHISLDSTPTNLILPLTDLNRRQGLLPRLRQRLIPEDKKVVPYGALSLSKALLFLT